MTGPDREEVRWVADEMLGRLARYLRFLGYDVLYARGMRDADILKLSRSEDRKILTRDRLLAERGKDRAVLIRSHEVGAQLGEVRKAFPGLRVDVTFVRCSTCNGPLTVPDRSTPTPPRSVPEDVWMEGVPVHVCKDCGQAYWEGSHTREIRKTLALVFGGAE